MGNTIDTIPHGTVRYSIYGNTCETTLRESLHLFFLAVDSAGRGPIFSHSSASTSSNESLSLFRFNSRPCFSWFRDMPRWSSIPIEAHRFKYGCGGCGRSLCLIEGMVCCRRHRKYDVKVLFVRRLPKRWYKVCARKHSHRETDLVCST